MRMTLKHNNARGHLVKFERSFVTRCIRWMKPLGLGIKTDRSNSFVANAGRKFAPAGIFPRAGTFQ
jgi:hypothetical protein